VRWGTDIAVVVAGALIATSILIADRWQIAAYNSPYAQAVYRLDRWTGRVDFCGWNRTASQDKDAQITCPMKLQ
jgi:hypothetical protein